MTPTRAFAIMRLAGLILGAPAVAAAQALPDAVNRPAESPAPSPAPPPMFNNAGPASLTNTHLISQQDLVAVNSGNTITANMVGSGPISLSGSALSGFSGIGNFVMNTGHNNNLQGSVSVIINVTP